MTTNIDKKILMHRSRIAYLVTEYETHPKLDMMISVYRERIQKLESMKAQHEKEAIR